MKILTVHVFGLKALPQKVESSHHTDWKRLQTVFHARGFQISASVKLRESFAFPGRLSDKPNETGQENSVRARIFHVEIRGSANARTNAHKRTFHFFVEKLI